MDVLAFLAILVSYIWVVMPLTQGDPFWSTVFTISAVAVVLTSLWMRRAGRDELGLRLDNFFPALFIYLGTALPYAGIVLYMLRDEMVERPGGWHVGEVGDLLLGAFLQELCLLAFLLYRFEEMLGGKRVAILAAAAVFSFFHLPNPFLTLYTLGGGLILAILFSRVPNLLAAAVAHAVASSLVSGLLPGWVTGFMKVGPQYWWPR